MMQFDTTKYLIHGSVSFAGLLAYNVLVEGRPNNSYSMKDAGCYSLSSVSSLWAADILESLWGSGGLNHTIQGMITKPLLNGLFYMYLYNYLVRENYQNNRSNNTNFMIGAFGDIVVKFTENPLAGLFGFHVYN